ncbi:MAG: carboxypeptidase-like regulatory domain-containing protein [Deltaproteobacteria bacterium]
MIRFIQFIFVFFPIFLFSQTFTISGYVEDLESGEKLISAYVYDTKSGKGAVTNTYGFYSLTLPRDSVLLNISYIGYTPVLQRIFLNKNLVANFRLTSSVLLKEIEITGKKLEKIEERTQMSRVEVPIEHIKSMPALFGEVDVLKALQLLPGVQAGTEGTSGLYVRGGSPDQNLVLLDNVPVYHVSHLMGIFSVFNADALKNVSLTKGGFPARYGGRLSSVIDINMKDGNMKEYHGSGSISNLASKLMIEGPIIKDKASFIVSGRRSYADLFLKPFLGIGLSEGEKVGLSLYFYDINAKANYKINDKNRLYLSFYSGKDIFGTKFSDNSDSFYGGIFWGNIIGALRWNCQLSPKLFLNTTATLSDFKSGVESEFSYKESNLTQSFSAKYNSGIKDYGLKLDFDYIPVPSHYIKFGINYINHTYNPGAIGLKAKLEEYELDTLIGYNKSSSNEFNCYAEDDFSFGNFKTNLGIHLSGFSIENEFYSSLQPRIGIRYLLDGGYSIKGSYSTMKQYINLLTSEALTTPFDLWVPSTEKIKPQFSWQAAAGMAKTFKNDFELSIEAYYKKMQNVLSYNPGESFFEGGFGETDWESKVTQGNGETYGLEFLLQKNTGVFTGWIAYTLAWNWRQFPNINAGEKFPFKYDRRHDFAIVGTYKISERVTLSANWIYSTGNAITLATFKYPHINTGGSNWLDYFEIENIGQKNSFRMSDTHRLDVSIEFHKKKKRWERTWVLGVYNAYSHKNPFFIYPDRDFNTDKTIFKEVSLLPFLPSITYQFKF